MKKGLVLTITLSLFIFVLAFGCSKNNESAEKTSQQDSTPVAEVEVKDIHGTVKVKVKPEKVVALDNRTFETLADWGVKLVAVPKGVMPADSPYVKDASVKNIGNHREPNLEIIAAANPTLLL
ncbi:hypothetical protein HMPREF9554_01447 [Treponema phagedenis F0421]|nr:ABC transporter substrate-binding protein [Treponema phagedenis]EFW38049.1 hypothetical protein HMPREF9554_01447 [Treponema phagedenis F0421]